MTQQNDIPSNHQMAEVLQVNPVPNGTHKAIDTVVQPSPQTVQAGSTLARQGAPEQNAKEAENKETVNIDNQKQEEPTTRSPDQGQKAGKEVKSTRRVQDLEQGKSGEEREVQRQLRSDVNNSGEKCWNKLCRVTDGLKKVKSKVDDRVLTLCRECARNYNDSKYCQVCQQIYYSEEGGDGLQWVLCESGACSRWNHTECERKRSRFDGKNKYLCSDCQKRIRRKRVNVMQTLLIQEQVRDKKPLDSSSMKKIRIFDVRKDNYSYLESFLSSYSYRLALAEDAITNDIVAIKQRQNDHSQLQKKGIDVLGKKKKR